MIDPVSVFSSIVCSMTQLGGSQVSDRCPSGYLFHFSMKFMSANRIAPDGTPRFAELHLGLFCLPMSHKKDVRLIWVKTHM